MENSIVGNDVGSTYKWELALFIILDLIGLHGLDMGN